MIIRSIRYWQFDEPKWVNSVNERNSLDWNFQTIVSIAKQQNLYHQQRLNNIVMTGYWAIVMDKKRREKINTIVLIVTLKNNFCHFWRKSCFFLLQCFSSEMNVLLSTDQLFVYLLVLYNMYMCVVCFSCLFRLCCLGVYVPCTCLYFTVCFNFLSLRRCNIFVDLFLYEIILLKNWFSRIFAKFFLLKSYTIYLKHLN